MIGRMGKWSLAAMTIWTLAGCGSSDRPTVRQKSIAQSEEKRTDASTNQHEPNSLERALQRAQADGTKPDFAGFDHAAHAGLPKSAIDRLKNRDRNAVSSPSEGALENDPHAGLAAGSPTTNRRGATGSSESSTESPRADSAAVASARGAQAGGSSAEKSTSAGKAGASAETKGQAGKDGVAGAAATATDDPRVVAFGGFQMTAPENWVREEPPVTFILAAFQLPGARGGATNAQLTVTLPVNNDQKSMTRLRDQVREEIEAGESKVERIKLAGHEVILVDSTVEEEADGDNSPATVRKGNYRSLNAMLFIGNSVYFLNCTGPERTVATHYNAYRDFLQTLKSAE